MRCDGNARERHSNVDRPTRWNEGRKERRARACAERTRRRTKTARPRETRATRVWARGGADRSNDRSIHHRHRICTFATCARSRAIGVSRERQNSPRRSLLRPHVERHQFRERLGLAQSLEFGGVRLFRLTNGKHRPRESGDLHASSSPSSVSLAPTHAPTDGYILSNHSSNRARLAASRALASDPNPPLSFALPPAIDVSTLESSRHPISTHPIPSHPPSLARTKHIKNTLGPYSQSDSPGGASTLYTIPSRMNITRAQENMNHTVTCRPTNVLFSSSSLVTIASSLLSSRSSTTVVDVPSPRPRPRPRPRPSRLAASRSSTDPLDARTSTSTSTSTSTRAGGRSRSVILSLSLSTLGVFVCLNMECMSETSTTLCDVLCGAAREPSFRGMAVAVPPPLSR